MAYCIKHLVEEWETRPRAILVLMFNTLARKQFIDHLDKIGLSQTRQHKNLLL